MNRIGWMPGAGLLAMAAATPAVAADAVKGGVVAAEEPAATTVTPEDDQDAGKTITVTATRAPVAVEDAPATVTVIDANRIADELATDIKDLIRFEPGISVPRQPTRFGAALGTTGRAGNEGFNIRGIGGNRVLIQVDGVRVPDGFSFGAQGVGRGDYVDLGLIKSVEILRGPASALYGSDGLAGAVSFITSDPKDFLGDGKSVGGLARAAYSSSDNEFSETVILAGKSGDWSAMGAYTRRDYNELDNRGTVGGVGSTRTEPNPQDGRSNAGLGRIVYESGGHRFRLTGEYLDTHLDTEVLTGRSLPPLGSTSVLDLDATDTGSRWRGAFDWTWSGSGIVELARLAAWYQQSKDRQFTLEDRNTAADRTRINTFDNRVIGASGELRLKFDTGAIGHRIVFGADASKTHQEGLRDGTVPPAGETFPTRAFPETDYTLAGAFVADEMTIGPVSLYPALRFDYYDPSPQDDPLLPTFAGAKQDGSRVSPKIGAVVKLSDGLRVFGNYGRGFKSPEPNQVNQFFSNLAFGYTSRPNPDLKPETSESYEGGIRISGPNVRLDVSAYHANFDDFISQEVVNGSFTPADPAIYQFINLNKAEIEGAEARFEAWSNSGITGRMSISYTTGDQIGVTGAKTPLLSVDPFKLVFGGGYRDPAGRFGGQLITTHSAKKELARAGGQYRPDAFTTLDATAFVKVMDAVTLRGGVFNITNEKYAWWSDTRGLTPTTTVADAYTQPGRNGSVSLSVRF